MRINFAVDGRPPRKYASKSGWGKDEAHFILKLREKALEARTKAGMEDCFRCPVRLELTIYAPNVTDKVASDHIGDLDALVAGVCEAIQPAHPYAPINMIFKGKDNVNPKLPLLVADDSLIVSIIARKVKDSNLHYVVAIEPELLH